MNVRLNHKSHPAGWLLMKCRFRLSTQPETLNPRQCKVVALSEVRSHLPAGTRFVTADERKTQLAGRAASYAWRLAER